MRGSRIAVCHEWITTVGGSEKVAARIASALDARQVFAYAVNPELAKRMFPNHTVRPISAIGTTRFAWKRWQWLLPLMPRAWACLDLEDFDLVVTSAHSCVNSIRVRRGRHVSYCHTPMRYAWEWRSEIGRIPWLLRPIWPMIAAVLRSRDRRWAQGVDEFIANSSHVARRIRQSYGRDAQVVYPPVETEFWVPSDKDVQRNYFLCAGRLVAYKRLDICIDAAALADVPLVIAGDGPEMHRLRRVARGRDVTFVSSPTRSELRDLYRRARALVFAGVEDFGMTFVEAQACGTPVIAFNHGGATEAIVDGRTGTLFNEQSSDALAEHLRAFNRSSFATSDLRQHAESFSVDRFDRAIRAAVLR